MNTYCRIAAYCPEQNIGFIADSHGRFSDLLEFVTYFVDRGIKIIAVSDDFDAGDLPRVGEDKEHIIIRACGRGSPNRTQTGIELNGKRYIP